MPRFLRGIVCAAAVMMTALAWADDLAVSAKVDKTTVDLLSPLQLTITLGGDLTGLKMDPLEFPEGFTVASRSQATNFSIRGGMQERSMNLLFILIPSQAGTFQLGPFAFSQDKREFHTEPIEVTVKKPAVPPHMPSSGPRYTL